MPARFRVTAAPAPSHSTQVCNWPEIEGIKDSHRSLAPNDLGIRTGCEKHLPFPGYQLNVPIFFRGEDCHDRPSSCSSNDNRRFDLPETPVGEGCALGNPCLGTWQYDLLGTMAFYHPSNPSLSRSPCMLSEMCRYANVAPSLAGERPWGMVVPIGPDYWLLQGQTLPRPGPHRVSLVSRMTEGLCAPCRLAMEALCLPRCGGVWTSGLGQWISRVWSGVLLVSVFRSVEVIGEVDTTNNINSTVSERTIAIGHRHSLPMQEFRIGCRVINAIGGYTISVLRYSSSTQDSVLRVL
ncbi:hypothetical protein AG1IA_07277 [Rhizoctonia solani AG-1 IA]|uniref:Uncharacterized protein n=1 Tax=Thanatephorus cucumeris (strain AG1-IA) TaxID=983506 RepID=L8WKG9_THACA|nr:hypothetical protein AG1IA_07277 [Rhizoctonia solani AG-1 IA]